MRGKQIGNYRKACLGLTLAVVLILCIAGCGGGGGGGSDAVISPTPTSVVVNGYVTLNTGGEALSGVNVTAVVKSSKTVTRATTGTDGSFSLTLSPGTYDLTASLTGYGITKIQDLELEAGENQTVNIALLPVLNPDWAVSAPTITSITGLPSTPNVSSTYNVTVQTSGDNAMRFIEMRIGNRTSVADYAATDTSTMLVTWDTTELPPPPDNCYVHITARDVNNNRVEKTVYLDGSESPTNLSSPDNLSAVAYTFPYEYTSFREDYLERTGCTTDFFNSNVMKLPAGLVINPKTAPAGANLFTILNWDQVSGSYGYRVYRREGTSGDYALIGSTAAGNYTQFIDQDPLLAVGKTYYYQVAAYNQTGTGQVSTSPPTSPLNNFTVTNSSPAHNQEDVSTNPDYSWTVSRQVGDRQEYYMLVIGINDSTYSFTGVIANSTSASNVFVLNNNTVYEWGIYNAAGLGSYDQDSNSYKAISIGLTEGTSNFTTAK